LYIFATLVVFLIREIVPIWMIAIIIGRDLILGVITLAMNRRGFPPFTVTYLGKAATFNLLYAFPFLLLAQSDGVWGSIAFVAGWSFAIWGVALYISTGISYARDGISQMRGNYVINS
jgi:cardiolipin synthase